MGLLVFLIKIKLKLSNKYNDMGLWDFSTIIVVKKDNPGIVENYLMSKTPTQVDFRL